MAEGPTGTFHHYLLTDTTTTRFPRQIREYKYRVLLPLGITRLGILCDPRASTFSTYHCERPRPLFCLLVTPGVSLWYFTVESYQFSNVQLLSKAIIKITLLILCYLMVLQNFCFGRHLEGGQEKTNEMLRF